MNFSTQPPFGLALDQFYFSPKLTIPTDSSFVLSDLVLEKKEINLEEAIKKYQTILKTLQSQELLT